MAEGKGGFMGKVGEGRGKGRGDVHRRLGCSWLRPCIEGGCLGRAGRLGLVGCRLRLGCLGVLRGRRGRD